jgi:hypothetical protein
MAAQGILLLISVNFLRTSALLPAHHSLLGASALLPTRHVSRTPPSPRTRCIAAELPPPPNTDPVSLSEYVMPPALVVDDLLGYWELEEAEDDCTAHTLVHVLPGGALDFGTTDGPIPTSVQGSWKRVEPPSTSAAAASQGSWKRLDSPSTSAPAAVSTTTTAAAAAAASPPDGEPGESIGLQMSICRSFEDVRFPYSVERVYGGCLERDGPLVLMQGPIQIIEPGARAQCAAGGRTACKGASLLLRARGGGMEAPGAARGRKAQGAAAGCSARDARGA